MAYAKVLTTTPALGVQAVSASSMGMDWVFIDAFIVASNSNPAGFYSITSNANTQWDQLKEVLNYCGRDDITSAALAQTWYQAQTPVNFVNAIRKYLVEKFFPGLINFINSFVATNPNNPPPATFTTMLEGWNYILGQMQVTYAPDGKVASITI